MSEPILLVKESWQKKIFTVKKGDLYVSIGIKYKYHLTPNLKYEIYQPYFKNGINDKEEEWQEYEVSLDDDLDLFELRIIALKSCYTFLKSGALTLENENINNTPKQKKTKSSNADSRQVAE
jgi:hypothetical protein